MQKLRSGHFLRLSFVGQGGRWLKGRVFELLGGLWGRKGGWERRVMPSMQVEGRLNMERSVTEDCVYIFFFTRGPAGRLSLFFPQGRHHVVYRPHDPRSSYNVQSSTKANT